MAQLLGNLATTISEVDSIHELSENVEFLRTSGDQLRQMRWMGGSAGSYARIPAGSPSAARPRRVGRSV